MVIGLSTSLAFNTVLIKTAQHFSSIWHWLRKTSQSDESWTTSPTVDKAWISLIVRNGSEELPLHPYKYVHGTALPYLVDERSLSWDLVNRCIIELSSVHWSSMVRVIMSNYVWCITQAKCVVIAQIAPSQLLQMCRELSWQKKNCS